MRRWFAVCATVLCLVGSAPAIGQPAPGSAAASKDKDRAKELAIKGRELFEKGDYAGAIAVLREAERYYAAGTIVRLRADAHRKLGQLLEARKAYQQVAGESLPADAAPPLLAAQKDAKAALDALKTSIPTLEITVTAPAGAAVVKLDGAPVAAADLLRPIEVDPGKHVVEVELPGQTGQEPASREVNVPEGGRERVAFEGPKAPATADKPLPPPDTSPRSPWLLPGIAFGVGGAGLVLGAVTGILTVTKMDEIRKTCGDGLFCPDSYRGEIDSARTIGHLSTVGFIVGAVGVAAGVVIVAWPKKPAPASVGWQIGPGFFSVKGTW